MIYQDEIVTKLHNSFLILSFNRERLGTYYLKERQVGELQKLLDQLKSDPINTSKIFEEKFILIQILPKSQTSQQIGKNVKGNINLYMLQSYDLFEYQQYTSNLEKDVQTFEDQELNMSLLDSIGTATEHNIIKHNFNYFNVPQMLDEKIKKSSETKVECQLCKNQKICIFHSACFDCLKKKFETHPMNDVCVNKNSIYRKIYQENLELNGLQMKQKRLYCCYLEENNESKDHSDEDSYQLKERKTFCQVQQNS